MGRQEFIDKHKHELAGIVVDAATGGKTGAELALWLRAIMKRVDEKLGKVYDDLAKAQEKKA